MLYCAVIRQRSVAGLVSLAGLQIENDLWVCRVNVTTDLEGVGRLPTLEPTMDLTSLKHWSGLRLPSMSEQEWDAFSNNSLAASLQFLIWPQPELSSILEEVCFSSLQGDTYAPLWHVHTIKPLSLLHCREDNTIRFFVACKINLRCAYLCSCLGYV